MRADLSLLSSSLLGSSLAIPLPRREAGKTVAIGPRGLPMAVTRVKQGPNQLDFIIA